MLLYLSLSLTLSISFPLHAYHARTKKKAAYIFEIRNDQQMKVPGREEDDKRRREVRVR